MGLYTTEHELLHVFEKYGPIEKVSVVKDAKVRIKPSENQFFLISFYSILSSSQVIFDSSEQASLV